MVQTSSILVVHLKKDFLKRNYFLGKTKNFTDEFNEKPIELLLLKLKVILKFRN